MGAGAGEAACGEAGGLDMMSVGRQLHCRWPEVRCELFLLLGNKYLVVAGPVGTIPRWAVCRFL